ncbi:LysR family transcriptional regulator [Rouxiella badensis]|uniref:LysR family transcriptional regulator n=1 Tax=Rouxiella badensis TaxID=1646377 RepID=UPI0013EF3E2D|nr:LysR family transcriptional regulator [Rouxiella badensis]MCC3718041.1 LysR family transcriptional regulator [Rouxiella badensis]MCC3727191.1 LysR family transcriptional regulator [Rouxiella badensis]MCC3738460.1 LysR family transcriptional regulator [Rouxiella badensis]QII38591.1 LysR family transcriptional regulator [Rouxiella badensis]WAT10364.1 LysR family transcriptional regulator [Rouxiella badensis]
MDLNGLKSFVAVAAEGGFGAASRKTGIAKTSLSRHVRQLEEQLDVRLLERTQTGFRLTDEGRFLLEKSQPLLAELNDLAEVLGTRRLSPSGKLRISVPTIMANSSFGEIAARYARLYPDVQLEVVAEDRRVDPVREGYDAVLRAQPSVDEELMGKRILSDTVLLVCRPDVQGAPLPFIALGNLYREKRLEIRHQGVEHQVETREVMRLSSPTMIYDAVLAGAGAALLPLIVIGEDIKNGTLVSLGEQIDGEINFWFLYPSRRHLSLRTRAFMTLLEEHFSP